MNSMANFPTQLALAFAGSVLIVTGLIKQTPNQCPTPGSMNHQGWAKKVQPWSSVIASSALPAVTPLSRQQPEGCTLSST